MQNIRTKMLGFLNRPFQWSSSSLSLLSSIPSSTSLPATSLHFKSTLNRAFLRSQSRIHRNRERFAVFSSKNGDGLGGDIKGREGEGNGAKGSNGGDDDLRKERGPVFNIKWAELLIDPDPDNLLAVALTGLLAWASVQVLWQLFFISLAILVAALKYSFIAALLLFILITLL